MNEKIDRKTITNAAGAAGLVLGLIAAAYSFVSPVLGTMGTAGAIANWFLWLAKLAGCIMILRAFLNRFSRENGGIDSVVAFSFGSRAALFSSIIAAAGAFIAVEYAFPDIYSAQLDQVVTQLAAFLDDNTRSSFDEVAANFGRATFVTELFRCLIYGVILSAILARRFNDRTPFDSTAGREDSISEE